MLNRFLEFIKKHALIKGHEKLLLAVSGGTDSMVLLHLCHSAGFDIAVAHCNFGLRAEESDGDEELVRNTCLGYGIPFFTKKLKAKVYAKENGVSTQMAARTLRYAWFEEVLKTEGFQKLVVAHHAQDNLETVLLNLVRGTSISGLRGMLPQNGNIIRPMLCFTREEIEGYQIENQIQFREDSSNLSDDYKRNFLRHNVVPLLKELNPNLFTTLENTLEKNLEVEKVFKRHVSELKYLVEKDSEDFKISIEALEQKKVGPYQLHKLIEDFGFNFEQAKEILEAKDGLSGKSFLSESHQLVIDRDYLFIFSNQKTEFKPIRISEGVSSFALDDKIYSVRIHEGNSIFDKNPKHAALDFNELKFPLEIRSWRQGDAFVPLGMKGKKKLSDFMIDQKFPLNLKQRVKVMTSGEDIVWVIGHRVDDRFKVTSKTQQIFSISEHV